MFRTRLISGIIILAILTGGLLLGGLPLFFLMLVFSLIGINELYRAVKVEDGKFSILAVMGYIGAVVYYILVYFKQVTFELPMIAILLNLLMAVYVFSWPRYHYDQVFASFFGVVYVAVMLAFIYRTRCMDGGQFTVWLTVICSWGCDTCAYCVGMLIGKHKMAPRLSPKKSVEGAIGGVAGAAVIGAIYGAVLGMNGILLARGHSPAGEFALICACGALISMVGDLAASAIKRNAEIKDYGKLIPGHGGILDRFDSVIFTAPLIWLLSNLLLG